ncbi:hypothetical protein AYO44_04740 [Planctomycetaceae bacterium SCGC AG-212-F19]|nr:hypothetical protein AYO44_04740 [Planctomycetaceae bacterium SCGC AG-212-F19]
MPQSITCPKCRAAVPLPGKPTAKLKCPKCAKEFALPTSGSSAPGATPAGHTSPQAKAVRSKPSAQGVAAPSKGSAHGAAHKVAKSPKGSAPGLPRDTKGSTQGFPTVNGGQLVSLSPGFRKEPSKIGLFIKRMMRIGLLLTLAVVLIGGLGYLAIKYEAWNLVFASKSTAKDTGAAPQTQPSTKPAEPTIDPNAGINTSTGKEELLAYVPGDADVIIGVDTAAIQSDPLLKPWFDRQLVSLGLVTTLADSKNLTGLDVKQLFERVIVAYKYGPDSSKPPAMTLIVQSTFPFDEKQMGTWATPNPPKKYKDRWFYDSHKELPGVKFVYMPNKRILVLSEMPSATLEAILTSNGTKPALPAEIVALIRPVERNLIWAVMPFSGNTREDLKLGKGLIEFAGRVLGPDLLPTVQRVLPEARGVTMRLNIDKGQVDLAAGVACVNEQQAGDLLRAFQGSWQRNKPNKLKIVGNAVVLESMERQTVVKDLSNSLDFGRQDLVVQATAKMTLDPLKATLQEGPEAFTKEIFDIASVVTNELGLKLLPERQVVLTGDEQMFLDAVNAQRKSGGLNALKANARLMEAARSHATNMAKEKKLDDELGGKDTIIRVRDVGYKYKKEGLQFLLSEGEKLTPKQVVMDWAKDELRKGILFADWTDTGVGVAKGEDGHIYYYQIYAEPDK